MGGAANGTPLKSVMPVPSVVPCTVPFAVFTVDCDCALAASAAVMSKPERR